MKEIDNKESNTHTTSLACSIHYESMKHLQALYGNRLSEHQASEGLQELLIENKSSDLRLFIVSASMGPLLD